jgi:curved DNA-binding protein CbpA
MALTHYEILGVGPDATHEAMRRAYQLRVQLLHPDRHMGAAPDVIAEAQRATTELNRAWSVLRDPSSRRIYDRCLGLPVRGFGTGRSSVSHYWAQPQPEPTFVAHA